MSNTTATAEVPTDHVIKYGPHAGHVLRGNYKISTDKKGRMIAHEWSRYAHRFIRCDLATALAGG